MSSKVKRLIESVMEELGPETSLHDEQPVSVAPEGDVGVEVVSADPHDRVMQSVRDNHIDAASINAVVDDGMRILQSIRKSCNLIPVNVDFIEKRAFLYFPTSGREEEFTFSEIEDLINDFSDGEGNNALVDGIEEEEEESSAVSTGSTSSTGSTPSTGSTGSTGVGPNDPVDNTATDELTKAINSATGLLNTPDAKLAALSKSTGVDLIGMKQKASQLIQKAGQSTVDDLTKSAEKVVAATGQQNTKPASPMNSIQP